MIPVKNVDLTFLFDLYTIHALGLSCTVLSQHTTGQIDDRQSDRILSEGVSSGARGVAKGPWSGVSPHPREKVVVYGASTAKVITARMRYINHSV